MKPQFSAKQLRDIGKIHSDSGWTPVQKKHVEAMIKDYRFSGVEFFDSSVNPLAIPTSFVSALAGPPLQREKLWWCEGFRANGTYSENCEIIARLTGRQVVLNVNPTNDMLDVYRTLRKPIFSVRHDTLLQGVVNVLLGIRLKGPLTTAINFLDVTRGCVATQKAPHGLEVSGNGKKKSGYIAIRCEGSGDIPLTHAMIALAYGAEHLIPIYTGAYEVSHLCHESLCVNMDHLLVETAYA